MNIQVLRNELQSVISGKSPVRFGGTIQSIACYLRDGQRPSSTSEDQKHLKKQEEQRLIQCIEENQLWIDNLDFSQYVSEGAEQRVYLKDERHVIKLNDAIYYESWLDYFHNLMLHNYFFADTAYDLKGFVINDKTLYSVVQQNFVSTMEITEIGHVKSFMRINGFTNNRNNDYIHDELGIIIEDLHDENVLTKNGLLYFIDTVFYITPAFWGKK